MPLEFKNSKIPIFAIIIFALTVLLTLLTNQHSIVGYLYFLLVWTIFILLFDKKETIDFIIAFLYNGLFTIIYVGLETYIYPESYGTTSPLGSWTDDSYFFSLCADSIPKGLLVREEYWLYSQFYSDLVCFVTPFKIHYPLDIVFFQSGLAAIISTYSKQYSIQCFSNEKLGRMVYYLSIFSPFLLMHGGVILIRDTFVAALFILSLCLINRKRHFFALVAILTQFPLRIGTAFILLPLYIIIYFKDLKCFFSKHLTLIVITITIMISVVISKQNVIIEYFDIESLLLSKGVSVAGREVFSDLTDTPEMNKIFLFIQQQPFVIKSILSGIYIFLYPFLNFRGIINVQGIDIRTLLLGLVYPVYLFWLNAYFFSALFQKYYPTRLKLLIFTIIVGFILIGIFSLQSRHKTILLPLFYIVAATGYNYSSKKNKDLGYLISAIWLITQLVLTFR